jgi:hypothetical protein
MSQMNADDAEITEDRDDLLKKFVTALLSAAICVHLHILRSLLFGRDRSDCGAGIRR